ncbi:MAG TPA: xanthine dehydrogenase family protein molybdopterin-binding subunit [Candidatus Binatia bacterium]|jgi:carbon-monoxide dehydrogenase large subunit
MAAAGQKRVVGIPAPRVEGEQKVSGGAIYALDVVLPGMLWAKVLRSPLPHARIKKIDIAKAQALAGVRAVLTGKDLSGAKIGKKIVDMPLLAEDVVRFVGEKVAAVAADSEDTAAEALDLIDVEYEELPAALDPLEAMRPGAPLIHPEVARYGGLVHPIEQPGNVMVRLNWKKGDVAEGFKRADVVVENTFRAARVHHAYIEPHSCVVAAGNGGAEVWASTKSPYNLRDQLAAAFKSAPEKFIVHPCYIGGDFGGKGDHNDAALCYALSSRTGRPVKFVMDYNEEFAAGNPRHSAVVRIKTGVKRDGALVALQIEFVFDSGAYAAFRPQGFLVGAHDSAGPYRIPHVLIEENYVYTNRVPCGYMRAPGHTQGFFATESQMDRVARKLGLDPVEFRRRNLMRDGDVAPLGEPIEHIRAEETLARAIKESAYKENKSENTGRGVAVAQWVSKGGESYAYVEIAADGGVTLSAAVMDVGSGAYTVMRQVVAEELGVPLDAVQVASLDTTKVLKDTGVRGSSSTRVHGSAAYLAAAKAKETILAAAAKAMGAKPEEMVLHGGAVIHGRAERRMMFAEIVQANGEPIVAEGHYQNMKDGPEASMVAQVAEVEVDRETGAVKIKKITTAHNTGTVVNPLGHQGQIDGAVVMGMGQARMEEVVIDDGGKVATANLGDYKIPTIRDIPELKTAITESAAGSGPYHSMSIGETAIMPIAAAIANAVEDAVGVRIKEMPITAEKVLAALKTK